MDYRTKFMMNEGCLILAYAYAVSGYVSAAAAMGFFSAFLAVLWHSESYHAGPDSLHPCFLLSGDGACDRAACLLQRGRILPLDGKLRQSRPACDADSVRRVSRCAVSGDGSSGGSTDVSERQ